MVNGQAGFNHGTNGAANDAYVGLYGRNDRVGFTFLHNTRNGDDYTDGADNDMPGQYESFETRWDVGARPNPETIVEYSGGYQKQNDLDYPDRILDATFFETQSHAVDVNYTPSTGAISQVFGQVYLNNRDHAMDNAESPRRWTCLVVCRRFGWRLVSKPCRTQRVEDFTSVSTRVPSATSSGSTSTG